MEKQRREKMKEYERFLQYSGVENLPAEEKKIYKIEKEKELKRKLSSIK
jgi:hypothetical protein